MSAEFNRDEHLAEIFDAAVRLAPMCTNGIDFSNDGSFQHNGKKDVEMIADRAWDAGEAFVARYHKEVEAASARAAAEDRRQVAFNKSRPPLASDEVAHG